MSYHKTRVRRVLRRHYLVPLGTTQTRRYVFNQTDLLQGEQLDARWGMAYVLVQVEDPVQGLSAGVSVNWLLPGGTSLLTRISYPLTLNKISRIILWEGPLPGRIELAFGLSNSTGANESFRLMVDSVVKRKGSNFDHGMWLDDPVTRPRVYQFLGPYEPNRDPENSPSPGNGCGPQPPGGGERRPRSKSGPLSRPTPLSPGEDAEDTFDHDPRDERQGLCQDTFNIAPNTICTPDESAVDWVDAVRRAGVVAVPCGQEGTNLVPDPEIAQTVRMLRRDSNAVASSTSPPPFLNASLRSLSFAGFNLDEACADENSARRVAGYDGDPSDYHTHRITFPPPADDDLSALYGDMVMDSYLGRCLGFDELWDEVSQGLEREKLSPAILNLLLPQTTIRQSDPWIAIDRMIDSERSDRLDTDWTWRGTAPWLDPQRQTTWYMISLLNLVSQTIGEMETIRTPYGRERRVTFRGRRRPFRMHKVRKQQAFWRLSGDWPPFLKIYGGWHRRDRGNDAPFRVSWMAWSGITNLRLRGAWGAVPNRINAGIGAGAQTNGTAISLPAPIPSILTLWEHLWLPYADAAAKLYAFSRLLTTMALMESRIDPVRTSNSPPGSRSWQLRSGQYEMILRAAKMAYRAYLSCLGLPGKTLIHELHHTYRSWEFFTAYGAATFSLSSAPVLILDALRRALRGTHCQSGCGQEKMGVQWLARAAHRTAFLPVATNQLAAPTHPDFFPGPIGTRSAWPGWGVSAAASRLPAEAWNQGAWAGVNLAGPAPLGSAVFNSGCRNRGANSPRNVFCASYFPRWPLSSRQPVFVRFAAMDPARNPISGNNQSGRSFGRTCWISFGRTGLGSGRLFGSQDRGRKAIRKSKRWRIR